MTSHDNQERDLRDGLSRWAEAGQPSMNLEEFVRERAAAAPATATPASPPLSPSRPAALRRLQRWTAGIATTAAAAVVVLALILSFPAWAGAAAEWPLIGPALTEIVLKDAGLAWAYQNHLIQGTMAEARVGGVEFRVLGVMADPRRTTVIYQVIGWRPAAAQPDPAAPPRPATTSGFHGWFFDRPATDYPHVAIAKVDGQGAGSGMPAPVQTPLGLVGTVSTKPLPSATATLEITVMLNGERVTLPVQASRQEADRLSQEVPVNQSQRFGDITIRIESVIFTPAETVVRYQMERQTYYGGFGNADAHYLEKDGQRFISQGLAGSEGGDFYESFPPVRGPFTLVIPSEVDAMPVDLNWPLQSGTVQRVGTTDLTLVNSYQSGSRLAFQWVTSAPSGIEGIAGITVLDAAGQAAPPPKSGQAQGYSRREDGALELEFQTEVPEGFAPVAVHAAQAGRRVQGPWRFNIPQP